MKNLCSKSDIVFICEHWLSTGELGRITYTEFPSYWVHLKSSMDPTEAAHGRPFGGCGFLCKKFTDQDVSYRPINCDSDRLSGVEVVRDGKTVMSILGVYMPFDDHSARCKEAYLDTLIELQSLIEKSESVPCMIVGDFKTRLPQTDTLNAHWYRARPFSQRSALLYDFCSENELTVSNFQFSQAVNYTYWNGSNKSYIDHILVQGSLHGHITDCTILCSDDDNVSDHFAITACLSIPCDHTAHGPEEEALNPVPQFPRVDWNDPQAKDRYQSVLQQKLITYNLEELLAINTKPHAAHAVEEFYNSLVTSIHSASEAAADCNETQSGQAHSHRPRNTWWTGDCTTAKQRMKLFFHIWKSVGRPTEGNCYELYRDARRCYRRTCRNAVNGQHNRHFTLLTRLHQAKRSGQFWNIIRKFRSKQTDCTKIGIRQLQDHFQNKFNYEEPQDPHHYINQCKMEVDNRLNAPHHSSILIPEQCIKRLIRKLRTGCSPGIDGVQAEHLRAAQETLLPLCLAILLSLCLRFCVTPSNFSLGTLTPIIKKPQLDPSLAGSYRPITVSVTISKLLELYILQGTADHNPDPCQYGFVEHRGTYTAISLTHDICTFLSSRGTPTYLCSLDAEGAFDALPHPVLFRKAMDVLPADTFRILVHWYSNMRMMIKWHGHLSTPIPVKRGTRQGGLSSPFLFNLFYEELVATLNAMPCGVTIDHSNFNVHCYADDLLLMSTTRTGLQSLIDTAVAYITQHGLRFNPSKSLCMQFNNKPSRTEPAWYIEGQPIPIAEDGIVYLGALLNSDGGAGHVDRRTKAATKAFYSLQSAGLHFSGLPTEISAHIYNVGVRSVLSYGAHCVYLSQRTAKSIESTQGKLIKSVLGLRKTSYTTPLIDALNIQSFATSIGLASLKLLRSTLTHSSAATAFYQHLMGTPRSLHPKSLVNRAMHYAETTGLDFAAFLLDNDYFKCHRKSPTPDCDGLIDSIRVLLNDYSAQSRDILQLLVNPF